MTKKGSLKCSLSVGQPLKLTKKEQEILLLLSDDEFPLTIKQIALKQDITQRAVQKTVKKLREKGYLNIANQKVRFSQSTNEPTSNTTKHRIRLHGQEWNIQILEKDQRYEEIRTKANTIRIDNNTLRLYENSIEIYSDKSFFADDPHKATSRSLEYWDRFFTRLECDLKCILIKNRANNIRLVNSHYAEINNELGQECEKKGYKIKIYANDDGKLWFLIDNSFNLKEAETVHPKTAKQDMTSVQDYFNDLRDKDHLKPSEALELIGEMETKINGLIDLTTANLRLSQTELSAVFKSMSAMQKSITQLNEILSRVYERPQEEPKEQEKIIPRYIY